MKIGPMGNWACRYKKNWVFSNQKTYCGLKNEGKNFNFKQKKVFQILIQELLSAVSPNPSVYIQIYNLL
jgi:hypothetical protein